MEHEPPESGLVAEDLTERPAYLSLAQNQFVEARNQGHTLHTIGSPGDERDRSALFTNHMRFAGLSHDRDAEFSRIDPGQGGDVIRHPSRPDMARHVAVDRIDDLGKIRFQSRSPKGGEVSRRLFRRRLTPVGTGIRCAILAIGIKRQERAHENRRRLSLRHYYL